MGMGLILVSLAGRESDAPALATALELGRRFGAHVEGLHGKADPRDSLNIIGPGVGGTLVQDMVRAAAEVIGARVARVEKLFADMAATAGNKPLGEGFSAALRIVEGGHGTMMARSGRLADLVVAARQSDSDDIEEIVTLEAVLFESGRPVLVVPPGPAPGNFENIAIAWDGSLEASRAVHGAMPLLAAASRVVVLSVGEEDRGKTLNDALVRALACQGITATSRRIAEDGAIGVALLGGAAEAGCGLMVMGGYGHSRLRERILGGVTRDVLASCGLPVLMAH